MCFTIPFSPFPSILRAPCVASKSVMALETLSPVAASYSACQFRSIEVVVVVQVCTEACSKENPTCKATLNLSSLKGWQWRSLHIYSNRLIAHAWMSAMWKWLIMETLCLISWRWRQSRLRFCRLPSMIYKYYSIHHLPSSSNKKILVKEIRDDSSNLFLGVCSESLLQEKLRKSEAWLAQHSNKNSAVCRFFLRDGGSFIRMHTVFITHTYHSGFQCRSLSNSGKEIWYLLAIYTRIQLLHSVAPLIQRNSTPDIGISSKTRDTTLQHSQTH